MGFATYIMTAATYLVVALGALTGSPGLALLAGLLFGLIRGLAVLLSSRCRSAQALHRLHLRLTGLEPASRWAVLAAEALGATVLGYAVAGWVAAAGSLLLSALVLLPGKVRLPAGIRIARLARHKPAG